MLVLAAQARGARVRCAGDDSDEEVPGAAAAAGLAGGGAAAAAMSALGDRRVELPRRGRARAFLGRATL